MNIFKANKKAEINFRWKNIVSVLVGTLLIIVMARHIINIYQNQQAINKLAEAYKFNPHISFISDYIVSGLSFIFLFYFILFSNIVKLKRTIQVVEINEDIVHLKTFPLNFKFFPYSFNAKDIDLMRKSIKPEMLEERVGGSYLMKESVILKHEGKSYYLTPSYFENFDEMVKLVIAT